MNNQPDDKQPDDKKQNNKRQRFEEIMILLADSFTNQMPFGKLLGFKLHKFDETSVTLRLDMKEVLIGNYVRKILHGGVIAAMIDSAGGIAAVGSAIWKMEDHSDAKVIEKVVATSTVDLRVDYLRPGLGDYFLVNAHIVRSGNKLSVVRMDFYNDKKSLLAIGTGTYFMSK